jgi:hypothetical protein
MDDGSLGMTDVPLPPQEKPGPKPGMKEKYEAELAEAARDNAALRTRIAELEAQADRLKARILELCG